jgi:hypothetical protein
MGRKLMRVPLDFTWPLNKVWQGYLNEFKADECHHCEGRCYGPKLWDITETWYAHRAGSEAKAWYNKLTQDEVDALCAEGRLTEFTSTWNGTQWVRDKPNPMAAVVNAWASGRGFGHDCINQHICIETRVKRVLGITKNDPDYHCQHCYGCGRLYQPQEGKFVFSVVEHFVHDEANIKEAEKGFSFDVKRLKEGREAIEKMTRDGFPSTIHDQKLLQLAADMWQDKEPPTGPGFQLWETTSEGSPISPVFPTLDALCTWLEPNGSTFGSGRTSKANWLKMLGEDDIVTADLGTLADGTKLIGI